jgi:hypothetical protein
VKKAILEAEPPPVIRVAIVWIHMLRFDCGAAARCAALTMRDPRVRHFYDPLRRAGAAVAASLGASGRMAWDIYLFYPAGHVLPAGLPAPAAWAHQLQDSSWADPAFYRHGKDLERQLGRLLAQMEMLRLSQETRWSGVTASDVWAASRTEQEERA